MLGERVGMTDNQQTVDAIRDATKHDERIIYWYHSPSGNLVKRQYEWSDIEGKIVKGEMRPGKVLKMIKNGYTPIARLVKESLVGTIIETEKSTGGYGE
jgi:hypothetical protein